MTRFSARSSLTEQRSRSRPTRRRTNRPPSSLSRYAHTRKVKPTARATQSLGSPLSFVYVGNLRSDVRNEDLELLFMPCGKVIKIDIRCCSGTAVPSGANASTVYATVLFVSVDGATRALFMDGSPLLGKRIVVAPSFLALPEASRSIRRKPISVCGVNFTKIRFVQGYDEFLSL
ncbi:hypothetical protein BGY98DRAFT_946887 [Russula aff. rugulosa BPL654]|nr:hypothetical protein BGY98DRAFT_946887 [Russula aff. rugulosa BPL654]